MFFRDAGGGYRGTEQTAWGWFLILFQPPDPLTVQTSELRAAVRYVYLHQFGHFMMGSAQVGGHRISLSGSYGGDGLPREAPSSLWPLLYPVPLPLQKAFWTGGGHNSAGAEAPAFRTWALDHFESLRLSGRKDHGKKGNRRGRAPWASQQG